jgi:hypothetical protein
MWSMTFVWLSVAQEHSCTIRELATGGSLFQVTGRDSGGLLGLCADAVDALTRTVGWPLRPLGSCNQCRGSLLVSKGLTGTPGETGLCFHGIRTFTGTVVTPQTNLNLNSCTHGHAGRMTRSRSLSAVSTDDYWDGPLGVPARKWWEADRQSFRPAAPELRPRAQPSM